jgi:hypothetical protein
LNVSRNSNKRKPFSPAENLTQGENNSRQSYYSNINQAPDQIYNKSNHHALDCFHHIDFVYQGRHPPSKLTSKVSQSNAVHEENEWLIDNGANNHITTKLENLTL